MLLLSGADPGLIVGGDANPLRGRQPNIFIHFLKNPMKLKKFWSVGGRAPGAPPLIRHWLFPQSTAQGAAKSTDS